RIHVGLIDLGYATLRRYGGAGFSINSHPIKIVAHRSTRLVVNGLHRLDPRGRGDVMDALVRLRRYLGHPLNVALSVRQMPPQHIGLGTKTALLLGILKGASLVAGRHIDRPALQRLSGRGGASGVGVNSFFIGGFIADGGQHRDILAKRRRFGPSSATTAIRVPPVLARTHVPRGWRFHLILPKGSSYAGKSEIRFFEHNTPVQAGEVLR